MSILVTAEHEVAAPLSRVFAHFIDFSKWREWMPELFSPIAGPERALRLGDKFKVRIGKVPAPLKVVSFRQDAEFGWGGGLPLLVKGVHVFKFQAVGNRTKLRSEETLSGLLALDFMADRVSKDASAQARVMMESFAAHYARTFPTDLHAVQ